MAVSLSNVDGILQKVIKPFVQDNFPSQTILLDQMKRDADLQVMNNNFYAPVRTSRHGGVTNLANGGSKLQSGGVTVGQANVAVKIVTGTFDIEKLTIDATSATKQSVTQALVLQAETLVTDFARHVNRQLFGDGAGVVSQVAGSSSATSFTIQNVNASVDDGRVKDMYGSINGDINPGKYLVPGMLIGIGTAAAAAGTIESISGTTVNISGFKSAATAIAANDAIYILDGDGAGAGTSEIGGIKSALSSTTGTNTYAGIARNTTGWLPAFGSTAEALTLSRMESSYLTAKEYARPTDKYAIFVNKTLYKKYGDILNALRRTVNETDLLGGWTGLEFAAGAGRVGVFLDYDVPDGAVIILNMDTWTIAQVSDMDWAENPGQSGGALLRRSDYLTYQATMSWFMNVLCVAPGANGIELQKTG